MLKNEKIKIGFEPVYHQNSQLLILGSFPSVKSRETEFYYGNKQNRFWKMLCGYFQEEVPLTVAEKKSFLFRRGIALWDMVTACEIKGSSDATIQNAEIADLRPILQTARLKKILLNGARSFRLFTEHYSHLTIPYEKMPSTSPANPRFNEAVWKRALGEVFDKER